ncbi:hypothetical protein HanPI659440_Chr15g0602191 [Helianthus annuus]|nr:hypothetical protein HanPI659440_Chr15g0602191 [Helianthus annuus]
MEEKGNRFFLPLEGVGAGGGWHWKMEAALDGGQTWEELASVGGRRSRRQSEVRGAGGSRQAHGDRSEME